MKRCVVKCKDGEFLNLNADCIDIRDGCVLAWCGEALILVVKVDEIISVHLSEKCFK